MYISLEIHIFENSVIQYQIGYTSQYVYVYIYTFFLHHQQWYLVDKQQSSYCYLSLCVQLGKVSKGSKSAPNDVITR